MCHFQCKIGNKNGHSVYAAHLMTIFFLMYSEVLLSPAYWEQAKAVPGDIGFEISREKLVTTETGRPQIQRHT